MSVRTVSGMVSQSYVFGVAAPIALDDIEKDPMTVTVGQLYSAGLE